MEVSAFSECFLFFSKIERAAYLEIYCSSSGYPTIDVTITHRGVASDFSTSAEFKSQALGTVTTDMTFVYTSPYIFDGRWTFSSAIEGMVLDYLFSLLDPISYIH